MVDTFSCDSCGADNIPRPNKVKLLAKRQEELPNVDGTTNTATLTQGMEVCPNCFMFGIVKNSAVVDEKTQRKFSWKPNKTLDNTFFWNQKGQKKKSKKDDDD